ncbi:hypothetical protein [Celeribacter naphthalenivorans]|uniref:hypothetical protein n=1 Tax=Celeribacter naphthalenivorans TaxID=1614694 RepID=UPI001CFB5459|nr:hypothetical protein [Celeribacter naphthalenivorans]
MLLEFIATISAGAGAAGIILGLQKLLRLPMPKWAMPAAAGLAMLAFTIWSDYSWLSRAEQGLGDSTVTAMTVEKRQAWRPWTYLFPVTTQFIALDKVGAKVDGAMVKTDMYLLTRRSDSAIVPVVFDCLLSRRADTVGLPEGDLSGATWYDMNENDPILRTACDDLR